MAIPAGTYLTIGIGAANRDPDEFPDPDRLDIAREPNRHLAFGSGPHVCIGLNVARLEGRIAIGRFLARFPRLRPGRRAGARGPGAVSRVPVDPGGTGLSWAGSPGPADRAGCGSRRPAAGKRAGDRPN